MCFPQGVPWDVKREVKGTAMSKRLGNTVLEETVRAIDLVDVWGTFPPTAVYTITLMERNVWIEYIYHVCHFKT
jgi:hypothetical protein